MGSGRCLCKPQFAGENCDRCADGYYYYPQCIRKFSFLLSQTGYPPLPLSLWIMEKTLINDVSLFVKVQWGETEPTLWRLESVSCSPFFSLLYFGLSVFPLKGRIQLFWTYLLLYTQRNIPLMLQGYMQEDVCTCYSIDFTYQTSVKTNRLRYQTHKGEFPCLISFWSGYRLRSLPRRRDKPPSVSSLLFLSSYYVFFRSLTDISPF